ncbi:MAG: DNA topoisomerase, partial [Chitinispirillaceae bacterium]|nr:DNA topoisomerase [Chitinispirillaceae bacterium]
EYGSLGLITYMRTDSTRIAEEALLECKKLLLKLFGEKYLPSSPRNYGKSKNAQDAHEAIRPSQITADFAPEKIKQYLTKDQFRLYELIWKRFLASQMEDAIFDSIKIDIVADNCLFRTTGSQLKFEGFLKLYDEAVEETSENGEEENINLPELKKGDTPLLKELIKKQHFTQPPPRYTEASLVKELEEKGIGRPSTYAQIIDTLKKRKYVYVKQRRFIPSEIGFMVRNILVKEFPEVFNVGFTAEMEASLDKIETGEADWVSILKEFYKPFSDKLQNVKNSIKEIRAQNQEVTDRMCPACKKHPLVIKWSRNGKFFACSGFPNCRYTESLEKVEVKESNEKCDKCGAPMVVLTINGNSFLGCSRYPECKNTKAISTGIKCPREDCDGYLVERKTRKKGKVFYGCSNYPKCKFATWDKPLDRKCPSCGYPILLEHATSKKITIKCPSCKYKEEGNEEE